MISDSHSMFDDRIYWKESVSLRSAGYELTHICVGDCEKTFITPEGIRIVQVRRQLFFDNRIVNKLFKSLFRKDVYDLLLNLAVAERASVYHLDDWRLLQLVGPLKKLPWKPKLIYEVFDPFVQNMKDYNSGSNSAVRTVFWLYAKYLRWWQYRKASRCDALIFTEENLAKQFAAHIPLRTEILYNYTNLPPAQKRVKKYDVIYTGSITRFRGAMQMLEAARICTETYSSVQFLFVGTVTPANLIAEMNDFIHRNGLQANVELKDAVPFSEIGLLYEQSRIGLGIFMPIPTHRIIMPIKTFEYMHYGLPLVASNFGHIGDIVVTNNAGLTVDPTSPQAIANAIMLLLSDESLYSELSENGQKAVAEKYRWEQEVEKLLALYAELLASK